MTVLKCTYVRTYIISKYIHIGVVCVYYNCGLQSIANVEHSLHYHGNKATVYIICTIRRHGELYVTMDTVFIYHNICVYISIDEFAI